MDGHSSRFFTVWNSVKMAWVSGNVTNVWKNYFLANASVQAFSYVFCFVDKTDLNSRFIHRICYRCKHQHFSVLCISKQGSLFSVQKDL
jgi:hypothetical protein